MNSISPFVKNSWFGCDKSFRPESDKKKESTKRNAVVIEAELAHGLAV